MGMQISEPIAPCASENSQESTSSSFAYVSVESQCTQHTCRVCWEGCDAKNALISPCACKGTQKYVHVKCLRRWQHNIQARSLEDERAYRCGVCRVPYSLAPPDPRWTAKLWQLLRGLGGIACVSLLAFGLAGPPWPHLALIALVLLGTRSHGLLAIAMLAAGTLLAALHVKGLRLMWRMDEAGRFGVSVIRHGAMVPGLGVGTLLVASEDLNSNSIFSQSVVLIYEQGRNGAKGVILNQPLTSNDHRRHGIQQKPQGPVGNSGGATKPAISSSSSVSAGSSSTTTTTNNNNNNFVRHHLGGPVGMPGEGARQEIVILHSVPSIEGSSVVLHGEESSCNARDLYFGGKLPEIFEVLEKTKSLGESGDNSSSLSGERKKRTLLPLCGGTVESNTNNQVQNPLVLVFHGIATWAEGQLEGEIRAKSWAYGDAVYEDMVDSTNEEIWQALTSSNRVRMIA